MAAKIKHKRAAAARWALVNPVLDAGEIGYETDTGKFKIGTGSAQWTALPYAATQPGHQHPITDIVGLEEVIDDRLNTTLVAGDNISLVYDDAANSLTIAANVDGGVIVQPPAGPFTLYFNGAVDTDWATLGNWWLDAAGTVAATALPTAADSVIATASISSNSGSEPTVVNLTIIGFISIQITVTGNATFDGGSNQGTVTGNATFNDAFNFGTVNGNATFNDASANNGGTVNGNATFSGNSNSNGTVNGDATFSGNSNNGTGTVNGNATFNDTSANNDGLDGGTVNGNATFNDSSTNGGAVTGTITDNR